MAKIIYQTGNLLYVYSGFVVHGCNAQGVMGSGVALAVKNKYPEAYECYRNDINTAMSDPQMKTSDLLGAISFWSPDENLELVIANMITQDFYGSSPGQPTRHVSYDAVAWGFSNLVEQSGGFGITDIHIPKIGAGLGGGSWNIISTIIEETVPDSFNVTCWIL